jgi:hypothetical protein
MNQAICHMSYSMNICTRVPVPGTGTGLNNRTCPRYDTMCMHYAYDIQDPGHGTKQLMTLMKTLTVLSTVYVAGDRRLGQNSVASIRNLPRHNRGAAVIVP